MLNKNNNIVTRVEKHIVNKNHELYNSLDELCFKSKNLYNIANYHLRQTFIICSRLVENKGITQEQQIFLNNINIQVDKFNEFKKNNYDKTKQKTLNNNKEFKKILKQLNYFDKNNKYLGYDFLDYLLKNGADYKSLIAPTSQQILRLLDKNWISFFEAIKKWSKNKNDFTGRPKLPNYLKKNKGNIIIFTNQNAVQKEGYIQLPMCLNKYKLNTKIKGKMQQIRILPRNKHFVIEVVYITEKLIQLLDNNKYISIDIGLDNLATMVNNCNIQPIIINGKKLKSINKYYHKQISHYREIAKRMNNLDYTNKMNRLTTKRNNMVNDFIHKASKSVLEYALSCEANTIIIGNNKDWKRGSSMSKKVNQSFIGIPHQQFIQMIQYKSENIGLNVIITEESYTSGTSFLDNELPVKENYNKKRRIHRGLFQANDGRLINSDVNGALQIMKKVFSNAFNGYEIEGLGLTPIRVGL